MMGPILCMFCNWGEKNDDDLEAEFQGFFLHF